MPNGKELAESTMVSSNNETLEEWLHMYWHGKMIQVTDTEPEYVCFMWKWGVDYVCVDFVFWLKKVYRGKPEL